MDGVWLDLRFALRGLWVRHPGFGVVAILSLALALAVNAAAFSVVNTLLVRPLEIREVDSLVALYTGDVDSPGAHALSHPNARDLRSGCAAISGLAEFTDLEGELSMHEGPARPVQGIVISPEYFRLLDLSPAAGRFSEVSALGAEAEREPPELVISHRFWTEELASDAEVIGTTALLNGVPSTIVGVAPVGFNGTQFRSPVDVFAPWSFAPMAVGSDRNIEQRRRLVFYALAKLSPGVTLPQAQAEVEVFGRELARRHPESNGGRGVVVVPLARAFVDPNTRAEFEAAGTLIALMSGLILLIAAMNVAGQLSVRTIGRRGELAVRRAVGANTGRLVQQLVTEGFVLAGLGGLLGLLGAYCAIELLLWLLPRGGPFDALMMMPIDSQVFVFSACAWVVLGVVLGGASFVRMWRPTLLRGAGPNSRVSFVLVALQFALSFVVVTNAALFVGSARRAIAESLGFEARGVVAVDIDARGRSGTRAALRDVARRLIAAVDELPGVERAALAQAIPLVGGGFMRTTYTEREPSGESRGGTLVETNAVSDGYFETLGIPLLKGRRFSEVAPAEMEEQGVAVINAAAAAALWEGQPALGQNIRFNGVKLPLTVVGVVGDVKVRSVTEAPRPVVYLAMDQWPRARYFLHLRSSKGAQGIDTRALDRSLATLEPLAVARNTRSLEEHVAQARAPFVLGAALLGGLGLVAVALACAGLQGLISHSMSLRAREMRIRVALGATPRQLVRSELMRGIRPVVAGVLMGLAASVALRRELSGLLFGASPYELDVPGGAAVMLVIIAAGAVYAPARRVASGRPPRSP